MALLRLQQQNKMGNEMEGIRREQTFDRRNDDVEQIENLASFFAVCVCLGWKINLTVTMYNL